jgi:glycosyltransferase involved in cell wall biosynthesis
MKGTVRQKKRVILVRSNLVEQDPRLSKEIDALQRAGYVVNLICWDRDRRTSSTPRRVAKEGLFEITLRLKAPWGVKVLLFLPVWWCFVFFQVIKTRWDVAHAVNFDSAIPVVIAAWIKRKPVVYEIFDTYEDLVVLPRVIRSFLVFVDKLFLRAARAVIIVDESRVKELAGIPNRNVVTIYNSPPDVLKNFLVPDSKQNTVFEMFYAGTLNRFRMMDEVIRAVAALKDIRLTIAGDGEAVAEIQKWAAQMPEKVRFIGRISYTEVLQRSVVADLLFSFYDTRIPLVKYASSNKLFEAMMCRKPILVGVGTSMAEIVARENCGLAVDCSLSGIKEAILRLKLDPELCRRFGANGRQAYEQRYSWEIMERRLVGLYNNLTGQLARAG